MLTICWPAGERLPTNRVGEISLWPRRAIRSRTIWLLCERWEKPATDCSWPRKTFSATVSPGTRSSSW